MTEEQPINLIELLEGKGCNEQELPSTHPAIEYWNKERDLQKAKELQEASLVAIRRVITDKLIDSLLADEQHIAPLITKLVAEAVLLAGENKEIALITKFVSFEPPRPEGIKKTIAAISGRWEDAFGIKLIYQKEAGFTFGLQLEKI